MEVNLVRLSRPILLRVESYKDDYFYQTIYGFWLPKDIDFDPVKIDHYVGYLCGLHDWSSGGDFFAVNSEWNGVYEWVDKRGYTHVSDDKWRQKIGEKCRKKLNLTYDIITADVDGTSFFNDCINEEGFVVNEEFYYDIKRCIERKRPS